MNFPRGKLTVHNREDKYVDYLRVMAAHKIVFQLDTSFVPGQVAGDALICRLPCVGGNGDDRADRVSGIVRARSLDRGTDGTDARAPARSESLPGRDQRCASARGRAALVCRRGAGVAGIFRPAVKKGFAKVPGPEERGGEPTRAWRGSATPPGSRFFPFHQPGVVAPLNPPATFFNPSGLETPSKSRDHFPALLQPPVTFFKPSGLESPGCASECVDFR